jgi:hypothetical protein
MPRVVHLPPDVVSHDASDAAIELAESAGLVLDASQRFTLRAWMGERVDGSWAAFECAHIMGRQNGKGAELEARQLAGLFIYAEELQLHTAHEFKTANEHFMRMAALVEGAPDLYRKVARIRYASGEQGIELKNGARLKFMARSGGSGRGFAGASTVYLDEAMFLQSAMLGAALPTMSTHWNPQIVYAASAGFSTSSHLHALRRRALSGCGGRLAYVEHTGESVRLVGGVVESNRDAIDLADRSLWQAANPTLGDRISWEFVESEFRSLPASEFARERVGVWEPELATAVDRVIPEDVWLSNVDESPGDAVRPEAFGVHVSHDGRTAAIGFAAALPDGRRHVGVMEHRPNAGVGWLPAVLEEIRRQAPSAPVAVNPRSDAGQLLIDLERVCGSVLVTVSAPDWAAACGAFTADVLEHRVRVRRQRSLEDALSIAGRRSLSGGWVWDAPLGGDLSPLVAVTLAHYAHRSAKVAPLVFAF